MKSGLDAIIRSSNLKDQTYRPCETASKLWMSNPLEKKKDPLIMTVLIGYLNYDKFSLFS